MKRTIPHKRNYQTVTKSFKMGLFPWMKTYVDSKLLNSSICKKTEPRELNKETPLNTENKYLIGKN